MKRTFRILELLWLVFGVLCLLLAAYTINTKGLDNTEGQLLLFGAFVSGILYSIRRKQRIKHENEDTGPE